MHVCVFTPDITWLFEAVDPTTKIAAAPSEGEVLDQLEESIENFGSNDLNS
jgi:hypothetical protein